MYSESFTSTSRNLEQTDKQTNLQTSKHDATIYRPTIPHCRPTLTFDLLTSKLVLMLTWHEQPFPPYLLTYLLTSLFVLE